MSHPLDLLSKCELRFSRVSRNSRVPRNAPRRIPRAARLTFAGGDPRRVRALFGTSGLERVQPEREPRLLHAASVRESPRSRTLADGAGGAATARSDSMSVAADLYQVKCGLETWFTVPGVPAPLSAPPTRKMALVTWLARTASSVRARVADPADVTASREHCALHGDSRGVAYVGGDALADSVTLRLVVRSSIAHPKTLQRCRQPVLETVLVDLQRSDPRL